MLIFWIIVALLIAVALGFVIVPLIGRRRISLPVQSQVNRELYRAKTAELEQDLANDLISKADFKSARDELARDLLADLSEAELQQAGNPITGDYPARGRLVWIMIIVLPAVTIGIYTQLSTGLQYVDGDQPVAAEAPPATVDEMIELLASRLEQDTGDLESWVMLGRSLMITERYEEAVRAYREANNLAKTPQTDLKIALAEAIVYANNGQFTARASSLVSEALVLDDTHQKALWLAGLSAFQQGRNSQAISHWQRLLTLIPQDNDELVSALKKQIEKAGQAVSEQDVPSTDVHGEMASVEENETPASIQIRVELSPQFATHVKPEDTVFVYATAVSGPPMPLALVRHRVKDLPLQVKLDDSVAMLPDLNLSTQSRVRIIARVSKSGRAQAQPGDLVGASKTVVTRQSEPLTIVISEELTE